MTSEQFKDYLRNLQKSPYCWPNDYFAWKKPDGSLFMVGTLSGRLSHILKHELEEDRRPKLQQLHRELGSAGEVQYKREYVTGQYSICPKTIHLESPGDGPLQEYDPVEKLTAEVEKYQYLGTWHDPDILMDNPWGYSRTLACGRWDLAKEHILEPERKPSLTEQISNAQGKASEKALNAPERSSQTLPKNHLENERT